MARRFRSTNGSACESVFAWFRTYAKTLGRTDPLVHSFYVLLWTKMHNELMGKRDRAHLPVLRKKKQLRHKRYICNKPTVEKGMVKKKPTMKKLVKKKPAMKKPARA